MFVVGLTGGIGTGKSEVAAALGRLGVTVIDADREGHDAYSPETEGWRRVVDLFGNQVMAQDGAIDRRALAEQVFGDPALLKRLNEALHPLIRRRIEERLIMLANTGTRAVVVQVPLLTQAGWQDMMDEVWAVTAPERQVVKRLMVRHQTLEEEVRVRIEAQGPKEAFIEGADVVIANDGTVEKVQAKVHELWTERIEPKGEGYDRKN